MTHPLSSDDISIFYQKSANFAILRKNDTDCILMQFSIFKHFLSLKDCFNKYGYKFDDVSKNGYSSPS